MTVMEDLLHEVVGAFMDDPDDVFIETVETSTTAIFIVDVPLNEKGKIIGRHGSVINGIKTIFQALGGKYGKSVLIELKD